MLRDWAFAQARQLVVSFLRLERSRSALLVCLVRLKALERLQQHLGSAEAPVLCPVWILVTSHCHRASLDKRDPAALACLDRPVHKALVGAPVLSDSPQIVGARWHTLLGR